MTLNNNLTKQLMHKKLAADLTSLAHSILQMKNKEDVFALKTKAHEVYEKLAVLAFVEEYINNTPNPDHSKEELIAMVENAADIKDQELPKNDLAQTNQDDIIESSESVEQVEENDSSLTEKNVSNVKIDEATDDLPIQKSFDLETDDLFSQKEDDLEPEIKEDSNVYDDLPTLEDELKDTISADVVSELFENAQKKSLNDKLQGDIQIGLNDRIAFVKNLFGGSQEDFNRVVSQLNSFKTQKEAKKFINKMVKPDYDWTDREEVEERFMSIVERKFSS